VVEAHHTFNITRIMITVKFFDKKALYKLNRFCTNVFYLVVNKKLVDAV